MNLSKSLRVLSLALAFLTTHITHGLPIAPSSNLTTTPNLERRECKLRPPPKTVEPGDSKPGDPKPGDPKPGDSPAATTPTFDCDLTPPTLNQIITHMRDPAYNGLPSPQTMVFFYTGLGAAESTTGPWMIGWLRSQGITSYFWVKNAIVPCKKLANFHS